MDVILEVLLSDLRWLAWFVFIGGAALLGPAMIAGWIAAVRTPPTRWRDVPAGIVCGWLASVLVAVVWTLFFFRLAQFLLDALGPLPHARLDQPLLLALGIGALVCPVIGYFVSARYFRWKIKNLGWKIDDRPPPLQGRYAFTLRTLLIVQIALVSIFGLWITARRDRIRVRTEGREYEIWLAGLQERLGGHGWDLQHKIPPLRLFCWDKPLTAFSDDVLDRILLSDRIQHLEVISDGLTDDGLKKLAMHQELHSLKLGSQQLTDASIAHLRQLPSLENLHLISPQLTDESLDDLQTMPSLRRIVIVDALISKEAEARFKEIRPEVQLFVLTRRPMNPLPPATQPTP